LFASDIREDREHAGPDFIVGSGTQQDVDGQIRARIEKMPQETASDRAGGSGKQQMH
jgi:hypothetical protein